MYAVIRTGGKQYRVTEGQRLEETLGSVDHQIWQCQDCGFHREKEATSSP